MSNNKYLNISEKSTSDEDNPLESGGGFADSDFSESKHFKINDLFEDLKETLESSVYRSAENNTDSAGYTASESGGYPGQSGQAGNAKENDVISELFGVLNGKVSDDSSLSSRRSEYSPEPKIFPSPSEFDEVLENQKKAKLKAPAAVNSIFDTKEVPLNTGKKQKKETVTVKDDNRLPPLRSSPVSLDAGKADSALSAGITYAENVTYTDDADVYTADEEINPDIRENDNPDMDLELLKAIGIGKKSVFADEDGFGSEKEISEENTAREIAVRKTKPVSKKATPKFLYKAMNKEYTNYEQTEEIFSSYRKMYISEFMKFVLGVLLFLMLFYMETAPYLKWKMPNILNINFYNVPYIWIDLQFLLLISALNYKSLIYGIKSIAASNVNVYSISFIFFLLAFIHTMLTLYMRYNNPDMVLYNSVAAYSIALISLYNLLDISAEITGFKIVSSKKPKYAMSLSSPFQSSQAPETYRSPRMESELFGDIVPPETSSVGGVLKTPFISNFFSRTYKDKNPGGFIKYFIYISLFAGLVLFAVFMLLNKEKNWYGSLSAVTALILGSVPLCSFIADSYPFFKAQKQAYAEGSAFVGARSLEESAETTVISLYDRDIFPSDQIKISGIKVYGNNRIDTVLQDLCVVFDRLNMSPADTFKASTNFDANFNRDIKFVSIDDGGICYIVNNNKLFLGIPEYISNIGLVPPYDSNFDEPFVKSSGSIMILSSETEVLAKVYIKYELTADFHEMIKSVKRINACLCIRTFDPNIDTAFLSKLGNIKKYPVKVLKLKNPADVYASPDRMESPVISKNSLKSFIHAVLIAVRTKRIVKSNALLQALAFTISIILAVVFGILGQLGGINAGHLFLLQSFWMLPILLFSGFTP